MALNVDKNRDTGVGMRLSRYDFAIAIATDGNVDVQLQCLRTNMERCRYLGTFK